jgi:hypothetical protein
MSALVISFSIAIAYLAIAHWLMRSYRARRLMLAERGEAIIGDKRFEQIDRETVGFLLDHMLSYRMTWTLTLGGFKAIYRAVRPPRGSSRRLTDQQRAMASFCFESTQTMMATNSLLAFVLFNSALWSAIWTARALYHTRLRDYLDVELLKKARAH